MPKIETTGDLRQFLCASINAVANGTMDTEKARNIVKMAGQVNESFYSEVKVIKTQMEMGEEAKSLGELDINNVENNQV